MANSCPVCKLALTDTRNFSLETVSTIVYYPCNNVESGCQQCLPIEEIDEHHLICDYRSYACRLSKYCSWEGTRDELKKHYFAKHDNNILIGRECFSLWKQEKPDYTINMIMAFDEMFYVHVKRRNDINYWAVQYIGRSEDVILFCFEVHIFTDQFNDRKLEFSEICHDDVKDDIDDIIDSGFCVAVPLNVLETYTNMEGVVFYKIEIKRA
ncbi:E3 ubiquitin-protein ligase sina-like [Zophobas morio]